MKVPYKIETAKGVVVHSGVYTPLDESNMGLIKLIGLLRFEILKWQYEKHLPTNGLIRFAYNSKAFVISY